MIRLNKRSIVTFIFCCCSIVTMAQQYKYKAALGAIAKTGFYQFNITPELATHLKTDLTDLRIIDEQNVMIPHITKKILPSFQANAFKEFPVLKNTITDSGKTVLLIENKGSNLVIDNKKVTGISEMVLFIKNSSVSRYATLSGSNDQTHWFIISDNILLSKKYETTENYFINSINCYNADYTYFKLIINNENADPFNILKVGSYYDLYLQTFPFFISNPAPVVSQKDSSNGRSYIKIQTQKAYHIDELSFNITGPRFYERSASIFVPQNDDPGNTIGNVSSLDLTLSSKKENSFGIKTLKTKMLYLVIDNKDNPPLKISGVRLQQDIIQVIAYLEKDKKYFLLLDNEGATKPDYDIEIFKDSIPERPDTVSIGQLMNIEKEEPVVQKNNANKWWLWPAIIAAIGVLALLTWKLLTDMKKTGQ